MNMAQKYASKLKVLAKDLEGDLYYDDTMRSLYATDASVYREMPLAVAIPKSEEDIVKLVHFVSEIDSFLIPRSAGTSLAGQTVGAGIVVDVSQYMNKIIEVNHMQQWAHVEPGVIRDQFNHHVAPQGLFFSPITSTANRATLGGMVGNNSSGTTSIIYLSLIHI